LNFFRLQKVRIYNENLHRRFCAKFYIVLNMRRQAIAFTRSPSYLPSRFPTSALVRHGRSSQYRRLTTLTNLSRDNPPSQPSPSISAYSRIPSQLAITYLQHPRYFSISSAWRAEPRVKETESATDPPSAQNPSEHKATAPESESEKDAKAESPESSESAAKDEAKEGEREGQKDGEKDGAKEDPNTPPPPHGDKTPWQVFVDTLQTEFKASKDWNESTKALQSGYEEFTQNPTLQKAKSAYEEASKTASSTTSAALNKTGKVIGQSAAWAWDTPVAKVVRKGASVAGSGLEKATRPVRETEAFKSVKNVIDDGSSTRYGGWIEKEERKRRRQLREEQALKSGKPLQPMEEDPK
jgi:mitochondrial import inner membrane translocase subunit TIM44